MGRALHDISLEFRRVFEQGAAVTGRDLAELCFDTPDSELSRTENAQLALFAVSMGAFRALGAKPAAVAGFSLGECTALVAAGVLSLEDGFRLVAERARLMQQASDAGGGAMSAILGLDGDAVRALAGQTGAEPVNFNCPGQVVIAGPPDAVESLERLCLENGARRAMRLNLSGAFHTEAMRPAADLLEAFAQTLDFHEPELPVYTNCTGLPMDDFSRMPAHLARHMTHPVLWQKTVETMIAGGIDCFVEVGQGQTLCQFVRKTDKSVRAVRTDSPEAFAEAASLFGGAQ